MESAMLSEETLNLANLPADVIRKILPMELESFNYLRLIAPRWNALSLEYLAHSKNLPKIHAMNFFNKTNGMRTLAIDLSERYLDYFGFGRKNCVDTPEDCDGDYEHVEYREIYKHGDIEVLSKNVRRLIRRCSQIERITLSIDDVNTDEEMGLIRCALDGATANQLMLPNLVNFNRQSADTIRDIARSCSVKNLFVSAKNDTLASDALDTLCRLKSEVAAHIDCYEIKLLTTANMDMLLANFKTNEMRERVKNSYGGVGISIVVCEVAKSTKGDATVQIFAGNSEIIRRFDVLSLIVTDY